MNDCPDIETDFPYPEQPMALTDYTFWTHDALDWIERQRTPFTADDLRGALPKPPHPNLVGAAFNAAKKYQLIRVVGYRRSNSPSRRQSVLRVWATNTNH